MATDMDDSNSDDKDNVIPPLIYPEDSKNEESLSDPPSAEPTPETGTRIEKPTKEPTSESDFDALSEPSAPTRNYFMGHLPPKDTVIYQKGTDLTRLATLEERTKEAPWVNTWKIRILGQDKSLESGEDLLTPAKIPSQIPINLEVVGNDGI